MQVTPFKLERYFAKYEFSVKYLLCSSDCDGLKQSELLSWADEEMKTTWNDLALGYTESLGNPLLREEISQLYKGIQPSEVLVSVPEEGIFIALNTILKKGDNVICTFPGYQSLYEIAQGLECEVTKWEADEAKGWKFDGETLKQLIKPNTKLIIFNFPHNPTGYLPTVEEYKKILDIAKEHNLYILSDEMYRFLEYSEQDRLPSACEEYENAVSLFGMSKTFGMAGVRTGWVITRNKELYEKMATFKDYTTICNSAPSELLSIIALRNKNKIIERHLERIKRNLGLLEKFFDNHTDLCEWVKPKAGTICFPKLKIEMSSYDFCEKITSESGIMLLPSNVYDYDDRHFRIGFGRENMPEVLEKLEDYLSKTKFN